MTKPLRIDDEAEQEMREAAEWYERQRPGLGCEFLEQINRTFERIAEEPNRSALARDIPEHLGVRRQFTTRFPYTVFYIELLHEIRILAVAHARRRPGYWRGRLP